MNYRVSVTGSQLPWCPGGPPCDFVSTIGTGNPNLDVETITAYELGYHAYFVKEKLSFDLKLYRELVRNLIGADRTEVINNEDLYDGENWTFGNFTDSDIEGVELALEINPSPYTRIIFSHSSLLNLNGINDNVSSEDLDATFPDDITSILAIQRMPNDITASFLYTNISRSNGLGTGNEIPGHARLDFRLSAEFGSSKLSGELSFVYQNMLDDYIDWKDQNIFENYRFINLSLKW